MIMTINTSLVFPLPEKLKSDLMDQFCYLIRKIYLQSLHPAESIELTLHITLLVLSVIHLYSTHK